MAEAPPSSLTPSSTLQFVIKLNALTPTPDFYTKTDQWHVTLGDSDQDR